jgi:small subunit ribosomal protein S16
MVVIRLARAGAKKSPFYHMVVTDSRRRRDSNYVEQIGYFNPVARGQETRLHLDLTKVSYWEGVGAQLSDRVKSLVKEYRKTAAPVAEVAEKPAKKAAAAKAPAKKAATTTEAVAEKPVKKTAKKTVKKSAE